MVAMPFFRQVSQKAFLAAIKRAKKTKRRMTDEKRGRLCEEDSSGPKASNLCLRMKPRVLELILLPCLRSLLFNLSRRLAMQQEQQVAENVRHA